MEPRRRLAAIAVSLALGDEIDRIAHIEDKTVAAVHRQLLVSGLIRYRATGRLSCGFHACTRANCCRSSDGDGPLNIVEFDRRH